ncbi:MAG: hypothetical protein R2771_11415 [Saprospiraceae bacterium]
MEGVILFADDAVFNNSFENKLFERLSQKSNYPVLPVNNLSDFERTTSSISTYGAILLDWEFIEELEGEKLKKYPDEILMSNDFYSLIFIYSQTVIGDETKKKLKDKFGEKIDFLSKISEEDQLDSETDKILRHLQIFADKNKHLNVPYVWSQTMNKSVQKIFYELEKADPYWIKDLYYSSYHFDKDGNPKEPPSIDANIQVINLFLNLLSEHLIQDLDLRREIKEFSVENIKSITEVEKLKSLYQYLYYTKLTESDAIMTGDIYQLSDDKYGIIISPECDMNALVKKDKKVELLCFEKDDFDSKFYQTFQIGKTDDEKIKRAYNQDNPRGHLLPVFPIKLETNESVTAFIDFRFSMEHFQGKYLEDNIANRTVKINSPYIQQLRQRYLAYVGRVGVPTIPESLRNFNLK